ncbi:MAG TPA: SAM-dependent methyltransferase [Pyrinomonadaceae bacterium]|jgi:SAM-dependent MidA family methyltransferase
MNARPPQSETEERVAPLAGRLLERIRQEGAITFRDWMEAALYDETQGYYARRDLMRWGRAGDYRTSAERTPLFAATFARYFAALYEELGAPSRWQIVEAGAGAGAFARGVLETLERDYPHVFSATLYVIDEVSMDARERARKLLAPYGNRTEFRRLDEIDAPTEACVIFSNELLDAFPVHRIVMCDGRLRELCVGVSEAGEFVWTEREPTTHLLAAHFERMGVVLAEGQIAEVNLDAEWWMERAARSFRRGYLVAVDYGAEAIELYGAPHRLAGTLRGFSRHKFSDDVLAHPGERDLTTTVNWTQIRAAGERAGLKTVTLEPQDKFLLHAGALEQLELLTRRAESEAAKISLRLGAREMILPGGMSESFQVLMQKK